MQTNNDNVHTAVNDGFTFMVYPLWLTDIWYVRTYMEEC